jgi:hypothetical protein
VQNVRLEGNTFETNVVAAVRLVGEPAVEIVDNQYMSNQADEQRA